MKSTLIVCTANKVRSPMAMEIANSIAKKRSAEFYFRSAGIAILGTDIDRNVKRVLEEINIFTDYQPVQIDNYRIESFDAIHVMTQRQKITLCSYYKGKDIEDKIQVLDIDNPFGAGIVAYRECRDRFVAFYEEYINE